MIQKSIDRAVRLAGFAGVAFAVLSATAGATNLQVLPIRMEVRAPEIGDTFTLRNKEERPLNVQVRIFRSVQKGGKEHFEPTRDVVVSPPFVSLRSGADYAVRVVRIGKKPVTEKETYRLIVDELPDPKRQRAGTVNFAVRYSLPVSFLPAGS